MKEISKKQLLELLTNQKGSTLVTIVTATTPRMRKKDNPYLDEIIKYMEATVVINFIYKNSVNRALEKEGKEPDFEPHERRWGTRIEGTPLVQHGECYYLECRFLKHVKTLYFHKGNIIDVSEIEQYFQGGKSNSEHQGVDYENEVIIRDFKIESIMEIRMNGEVYLIK